MRLICVWIAVAVLAGVVLISVGASVATGGKEWGNLLSILGGALTGHGALLALFTESPAL